MASVTSLAAPVAGLVPEVLSVCAVQYKCVTDAQRRKAALPGRGLEYVDSRGVKHPAVENFTFNTADGVEMPLEVRKDLSGTKAASSRRIEQLYPPRVVSTRLGYQQSLLNSPIVCWLLQEGASMFITMNPGYIGRAELPESLKVRTGRHAAGWEGHCCLLGRDPPLVRDGCRLACWCLGAWVPTTQCCLHANSATQAPTSCFQALFRPITVVVPDRQLIIENALMAEGFVTATALAKKASLGGGRPGAGQLWEEHTGGDAL